MSSKEAIDIIRDRVDIVDLISEHVVLRKAGVNHVGLCPFHAEKTPSFHVSSQKQFYHCFGCNKSGDIFQFLIDLEGAEFKEVLTELAKRAHVELPVLKKSTAQQAQQVKNKQIAVGQKSVSTKTTMSEKKILIRMQSLANRFYILSLEHNEIAQEYLKNRGVSKEMIRLFELGYAPLDFGALKKLFLDKKCSVDWMVKTGLFSSKPGVPITLNNLYDRFRSRIMFPIKNVQGRIVGFSGRIFERASNEIAKYINSPDSELFKKGDLLYGLEQAKDAIRQQGQVFLVEGNLDVISLHQHGYSCSVAPLGTALTDSQIKLLRRFLPPQGKVFLILDGDLAGRKATLKDIELFFNNEAMESALRAETFFELDVRVVSLPAGEDPDSLVRKDKNKFDSCIKSARPAMDYILDELTGLFDLTSLPMQVKLFKQLAPLLLPIKNPVAKELYMAKLASRFAMKKEQIVSYLNSSISSSLKKSASNVSNTSSIMKTASMREKKVSLEIQHLLAICIEHPQLFVQITDAILNTIEDLDVRSWFAGIIGRVEHLTTQKLLGLLPEFYRSSVANLIFSGVFAKLADPNLALLGICRTIEEKFRKKQLLVLKQQLLQAQQSEKKDEIRLVIEQIRELMTKNN